MHLSKYRVRNFRRLESVEINLENEETIFVGPNNSGKTTATAAFRLLVTQRGELRIHDFTAVLLEKFDNFGNGDGVQGRHELPAIEMDLWFRVSPDTEYGRVADFLPTLGDGETEIGVRVCFSVNDPDVLFRNYRAAYPEAERRRPLSHYLSVEENLRANFSLKHFRLERGAGADEVLVHAFENGDGAAVLKSIIRVDYVEAQRNIDDVDVAQSNKLSRVLADFYKNNLRVKENDADSVRVIDESNEDLTRHYEAEFEPLLRVIARLGFPSINDRALRVISNISPERALSGNTALAYVDPGTNHELPEAYNGLGFKNLIYIAVQVAHFQMQWVNTERSRPLCQLIFIEEPEVHLHAQVQQSFIRNIRSVVNDVLGVAAEHCPQIVITTHSSHIVSEAEFQVIRYFRRVPSSLIGATPNGRAIATEVLDLARFDDSLTEPANIEFLRKYLKLTHCDLFFADGALLIEGAAESLLMPQMIKMCAPELSSKYITKLEVGGAYSHKFAPLLKFLNLPTLVITDLDSVNPLDNNKKCRADTEGAVTSNASIKGLLISTGTDEEKREKKKISSLLEKPDAEKDISSGEWKCYVSYQTRVPIPFRGAGVSMIPRTFEECFIYENLEAAMAGQINIAFELPPAAADEALYEHIYDTVKTKDFPKVEFALNQMLSEGAWRAPAYIEIGLKWLRDILAPNAAVVANAIAGEMLENFANGGGGAIAAEGGAIDA